MPVDIIIYTLLCMCTIIIVFPTSFYTCSQLCCLGSSGGRNLVVVQVPAFFKHRLLYTYDFLLSYT